MRQQQYWEIENPSCFYILFNNLIIMENIHEPNKICTWHHITPCDSYLICLTTEQETVTLHLCHCELVQCDETLDYSTSSLIVMENMREPKLILITIINKIIIEYFIVIFEDSTIISKTCK